MIRCDSLFMILQLIVFFIFFTIQREGIAAARTKPAATRETAARLGYARAVAATVSSLILLDTKF